MKRFGLAFLCMSLAVLMTACATTPTTPVPSPTATNNATTVPGVTTSPAAEEFTTLTAAMTGQESSELSRKANEAAAKISEIGTCVTAIVGDTCIVGVTFDPQYKGALTDRIRDMVVDRVQSAAPSVERVAVTNDPEIAVQIGEIAEKISKTTSVTDVTGEFDTLLRKIQ